MNERREPKVFVRKYEQGSSLPIVRIYVKWLPFLTNSSAALFQHEVSAVLENVVTVRLHEFYIAVEWIPLDNNKHQNDVIQEVLIRSFITFLQKCRNWEYVEREDFEFHQLEGIARREDRYLDWFPTA